MNYTNDNWHTSFRYNYALVAGLSQPGSGVSRARLIYDFAEPDWTLSDMVHGDGSVNVIYGDLHGAKESWDSYRSLNPTATKAGELTNSWSVDGWK